MLNIKYLEQCYIGDNFYVSICSVKSQNKYRQQIDTFLYNPISRCNFKQPCNS